MFSEYMTKLSAVRKLTPEEEHALWRAYKEEGDESARRRIIEAYQPLVFREVMPYRTMPVVTFSLYAVHRVRGRILDFLRREGSVDLPCLEAETEAQETAKELLVDERASVAELAEHHALVDLLGAVMERLPLRERLVLEGVTIGGTQAQTMAESLGVTPAHIYRLQQRGIRRVRGMLSRFIQHWKV